MHKEFADWYRAVELEAKEDILQKRWTTIERIIEEIDDAKGLDLVRVFLGLKPRAEGFINWLVEAFKTDDATFPMKNNAAELRVLAGTLCIAGLENGDQSPELSEAIALAMVSSSPKAKREKMDLKDLITAAEEFLLRQSKNYRAAMESKRDGSLGTAIAALNKACTGNNTVQIIEKPLAAFTEKVGKEFDALAEANDVLKEETNILWWLLGGFSDDMGKPFSAVDAACLTLVAAEELAQRVVVLPGPLASKAFLSAAIRQASGSKEFSLADAIEKTPKTWRQGRFATDKEAVLDLCPVLSCIKKSLEGNKSQWQAQAAKGARIPLKEKLNSLEIATQYYTENLFLRALHRLNG